MKLTASLTVVLFLVILFISSVYAEEVLLIKELEQPQEGYYFVHFDCPKCEQQLPVSVRYGEIPNDIYDVMCPFCWRLVVLTIPDTTKGMTTQKNIATEC